MGELQEDVAGPLRTLRARFDSEVLPYRPDLWRYCQRLTGSAWDAEDLVQDTLQRAFAGLASLWQPVHPRAWLFRIATNLWIDRYRREVRAEMTELTAEVPGPDVEPLLRAEAHAAVAHLVQMLPPLQRVVFLLCETLGFRAGEAAALIGTTEGAVKSALHRARRRVQPAAAGNDEPTRLLATEDVDELTRRYIAAFDARDPDALAALLHEEAVTTIVGSAVEHGRAMARSSSLADWAQEPLDQWARAGVLEGRDVLFVLAREGPDRQPGLYSIIELDAADSAVTAQRIFFFTPELLEHTAGLLGVPVLTHGYSYDGWATAASG